ncbi:MAG: glycine oxidase ThiO [Polyangiaceae bacterium]
MHVVVVGGGIMGSAVALALRDRGVDVVLLERAIPGAEASSAAAGMLGAQLEAHAARPLVPTFVRARDGYGAWADELRRRTGVDVGHRVSGVLRIATTDDEARGLEDEVRWQKDARLHAEFLDSDRALRVEPELTKRVVAAAHFPDDAQVDPPSLLRALAVALARAGVDVRSGTTVERIVERGGRCVGVLLDQGELRADAVVLAAGSWSSLVPGIPSSMPPVKPARGQMVLLEERPPRVRTIVAGAGTYTVPRGDGRVLVGSTLEFVGFRREVTAGGVHAILAGALACVPSLADAQFASSWSNFRPYSEGPMLGASTLPGLFLATGHHRNGILLAKHTADVVTDAVLGAPRETVTRPK